MSTTAYTTLVARLQRVHALNEAAGHLAWDQETYMPPGGTEARALELGALSALSHELFTAPEVGKLLAEAEKAETDAKHQALLRETRWAYDRATKVPTDLVEALSRATTRALGVWVEARKKSDFQHFRPLLEEIVDLKRKYASLVDGARDPYEVLFNDYEPWIPLASARKTLAQLREGLRPLIERATSKPLTAPSPFAGRWPVDAQVAFNKRILERVGYDFNHGRLDVSAHPFSTGNPYDARITTRYAEDDPLNGLSSTMHEFGHSLYTLGLPKEDFGTPLGDARNLVVHESQSRLWENHVGRSLAFMRFAMPILRESFPGQADGVTPEAAWAYANQVRPSFIRVEADEITYHMHIALRFEIEEAVMGGSLKVSEIPQAWNEKVAKYLGIRPPSDAQGCLQDVHWSHGMFGYFPTYSLGSMLAAQVFAAFERERGAFTPNIERGEFTPLRAWLRERVHQHGCRYETMDLVQKATGSTLAPEPFLAYARAKFDAVAQAAGY